VTCSGYYRFYYAPDPGYSGTDTFTWRVFDGADYSNTARCTVTVQDTGSLLPPTVLLIVQDTLHPEIEMEVNRLKDDMENEGYIVKINPSRYGNKEALRAYLDAEYTTAGQNLVGAVLIGNFPMAKVGEFRTDYYYWQVGTDTDRSGRFRPTTTPARARIACPTPPISGRSRRCPTRISGIPVIRERWKRCGRKRGTTGRTTRA
jgi:hypothetical protein